MTADLVFFISRHRSVLGVCLPQMDKYLWEHVQFFLDRDDLLLSEGNFALPRNVRVVRTRLDCDLVATGPHSAPTKLGPGRVLIVSCAAFETNTSLAAWRTLIVVLDQELPQNQTMYVLIDTRADLDSSGKIFVVRRVLPLPSWSSSLSPGSSLAEVFLSVLPFGVWANNRRWSGARARQIFKVDWSICQLHRIGTKMDPSRPVSSRALHENWISPPEIVLDLTTGHQSSSFGGTLSRFRPRKNQSRTSGLPDTSVPRAMFPATLRSTSSWTDGSKMDQNHNGRRGGGHSFWTI